MHYSILPPFTPAMLSTAAEALVFLFIVMAGTYLSLNKHLPPFIRRGTGFLAALGFVGLIITVWEAR